MPRITISTDQLRRKSNELRDVADSILASSKAIDRIMEKLNNSNFPRLVNLVDDYNQSNEAVKVFLQLVNQSAEALAEVGNRFDQVDRS